MSDNKAKDSARKAAVVASAAAIIVSNVGQFSTDPTTQRWSKEIQNSVKEEQAQKGRDKK